MAWLIQPDDHLPEPHSPVRDERELGPTEDLDREPDGVPHRVVGLTLLFSLLLALLIAASVLTGSTVGRICGVLLALIAVPTLVVGLSRKAERERDHAHPSR